ncbi:MAG: prolipoprotein diacylglyceryl transferase [Saprospiraceae bacterium]|nr:prolipoprotein diacylglyceryl transferase [Saprospiraceae bacterium]MDW8483904.1 prolipoprotein diacylglyceryl transferase [Saprospiraceae bacterium]
MYPDLSYIAHALFGTEPDNWLAIFKTFGFFLAISFLVSAALYYWELKRKAREGVFRPTKVKVVEGKPPSALEVVSNALLGLILVGKGAYAAQHMEEFQSDAAMVLFSLSKMHWPAAAVGALLLGGLGWWESWRKRKSVPIEVEKEIWPHDRISEITIWAAVGGIVGAKVFDLFDNWKAFLNDPMDSLFSGGGLAFYGGLILGFVAVVIYLQRLKIPFLHAADAAAPALAAGYAVGRIGCQLSGDGDWGIVNQVPKPKWLNWLPDSWWASTYPHHVLNTPYTDPVSSIRIEDCSWRYCMELSMPVFPTPLYETLIMTVVFLILWSLRKHLRIPGMLFFLYLALAAQERFWIEKIRVNVHHNLWGMSLSQAEIISSILFIISIIGMIAVWLLHRRQKRLSCATL